MYGRIIPPPPGLPPTNVLQGGEQTPDLTLNLAPSSSIVAFGDLTLYRIGEGASAAGFMSFFCFYPLRAPC